MPNVEWEVAALLETSLGSLTFNDLTNSTGYFLLDPDVCKMTRALRVSSDNIPQGDGKVFHPNYTEEIVCELGVFYMEDKSSIACGSQLRAMHDLMLAYLQSLVRPTIDSRFRWQPTGYGDERMITEIAMLVPLEPSLVTGGATHVTFSVHSPFPYAIDKTQQAIVLADGVSTAVVNNGSSYFLPVIQIDGAASAFTITLDETGDQIVYDSSLPGGQSIGALHYAEFDFFKNTVFLDGDGADLLPSIDIEFSTFFEIPADTTSHITVAGAAGTLLFNPAWAG